MQGQSTKYYTETTGLPMAVWIEDCQVNNNYEPRIYVQANYAQIADGRLAQPQFGITISEHPKVEGGTMGNITATDVQLVREWIILNRLTLLKRWYLRYVTDEAFVADLIKLVHA